MKTINDKTALRVVVRHSDEEKQLRNERAITLAEFFTTNGDCWSASEQADMAKTLMADGIYLGGGGADAGYSLELVDEEGNLVGPKREMLACDPSEEDFADLLDAVRGLKEFGGDGGTDAEARVQAILDREDEQ